MRPDPAQAARGIAEAPSRRRPILVTGMARAGTSWIGKVLDTTGKVVYINEPLNLQHPPGQSPGVFRARVRHLYPYITEENEDQFRGAFEDTFALRYHLRSELTANKSPFDVARALKYASSFVRGRLRGRRPLLDDPYAALSTAWLVHRFGCQAIVVVRHPAALAASRKRLGWRVDLRDFLRQPLLARDWLAPLRDEIDSVASRPDDIVAQGAVLWRILYSILAEFKRRIPEIVVVRHEDLAYDPVAEFGRLFEATALPFGERARELIVRSTTGSHTQHAHAWSVSLRGISRSGFRRLDSRAHAAGWTRLLRRDEIEQVRAITGDVAALFYSDEDWEPERRSLQPGRGERKPELRR
jgi:Sulfotransferase family